MLNRAGDSDHSAGDSRHSVGDSRHSVERPRKVVRGRGAILRTQGRAPLALLSSGLIRETGATVQLPGA